MGKTVGLTFPKKGKGSKTKENTEGKKPEGAAAGSKNEDTESEG